MTELRILELLINNANSNNHFPKLFPECANNISKCISDILYDSLATSKSQTSHRLDILMLLRKCFVVQKHNFAIDTTNYDCLVNSIIVSKNEFYYTNDDSSFITGLETPEFQQSDVITEIIGYLIKQEEVNTRKVKLKDIIQNRDQAKCENTNFSHFNQPFISKAPELCSTIERLKLFKNETSCRGIIKNTDVKSQECSISKTKEHLREKEIKMAYALLNLNKSNNDFLIMINIFKNLSSHEELFSYEVEFIDYLWKNWESLQVPTEVILNLLEKFPFLYEKEIIRLCTEVLEGNKIDTAARTNQFKKMLQISKNNSKLLHKIKSIFYELYSYSNFNSRLCTCLELFSNPTE